METHPHDQQLSPSRTHYNKAYIDFYKQNEVNSDNHDHSSTQKEVLETEVDQECEPIPRTNQRPNNNNNYELAQSKITQKQEIDKDLCMDQHYGNFAQSSAGQKGMAKSQSQNRLMFSSPDSIQSKNMGDGGSKGGPGQQEKISFFKDQSMPERRGLQSQGQELLFKQHLQYSSAGGQGGHHGKSSGAYQIKQRGHHLLSHNSTKECTFCNKTQAHSLGAATCHDIFCKQNQLGMMIQGTLSKKYSTNRDYYNVKIVNDLIYNENTHVVSIFKDYLILDDINEFLKRSYNTQETKVRLPKLCSFYDKYSQVFPNYVCLPESKYMFKNIQRKQKLIDEQYQLQEELQRKQHQTLLDEDKMFNSKFYNSVYKMDMSMTRQQYEEQAKQIATQVGRKPTRGRIEEMKIEELVDRFLLKDSESNIVLMTTMGLDFSGFTQSTIAIEKTPNKQPTTKAPNHNRPTSTNVFPVPQRNAKQTLASKKEVLVTGVTVKKPITGAPQSGTTTQSVSGTSNKRQKSSFNTNNQGSKVGSYPGMAKLDIGKTSTGSVNQQLLSGSTKTTPRLKKSTPYTSNQDTGNLQLIQQSPATKEAVNNYLQLCQIDLVSELETQNKNIQVLDSQVKSSKKTYESPNIKSPIHTQSQKVLQPSGSQTVLAFQHGNMTGSMVVNNRQTMRSQCTVPTVTTQINQITNLKKSTRLSGGQTQLGNRQVTKKQVVSPVPQNIYSQTQQLNNQLYQTTSRNIAGNNSTQKSAKSASSHAKYLSGGNDHYQRMLSQANAQQYATHDYNQGHLSTKKSQQAKKQEQPEYGGEHDIVTGEDCEDGGIADERFASPDAFSTEDYGRRSVESRQQNPMGIPMMLTSTDDKLLNQFTNYDQIKKHLEKYINNNQTAENNQTQQSAQKNIAAKSSDKKYQESEYARKGMNRNLIPMSACGSIPTNTDTINSRNGQTQKHFESLKQRIRGAFDGQTDSVGVSSNKTPVKNATISKKSQDLIQANNRMSIESRDMMPVSATNLGCLSSTSAAGRTLSFSQAGFATSSNYRSTTNLQQRKSSNTHYNQEQPSIEKKRMSQKHQSFKEMDQKVMKRCATGKTLSINEVQNHTFGGTQQHAGFLSSVSSTLHNPTFISSSSKNQTQHQVQAANTVRVMTPSYSLASLSKLISPTTTTSPITMTVTLAGSTQGRKQTTTMQTKKGIQNSYNPSSGSLIASNSQQNFMLAEKNNKIISSHKNTNTLSANKTKSKQPTQPAAKHRQPILQTSNSAANLMQMTPRGQQQADPSMQQYRPMNNIDQSLSCTVSTENNSATAKTLESKHPKFMRTIEEGSTSNNMQSYNNILSSSMGFRKPGMTSSSSQAQFDLKAKSKIQSATGSAHQTGKKQGSTMTLQSSASVSHFKSPSQQIQTKKSVQGKYQGF